MEEFFGPEENMDEVGQELSGLVCSWQQGAGLIARFLVETVSVCHGSGAGEQRPNCALIRS